MGRQEEMGAESFGQRECYSCWACGGSGWTPQRSIRLTLGIPGHANTMLRTQPLAACGERFRALIYYLLLVKYPTSCYQSPDGPEISLQESVTNLIGCA
jgi:hypothetical protein